MSALASSFVRNPYPLVALNHFTVPVANDRDKPREAKAPVDTREVLASKESILKMVRIK